MLPPLFPHPRAFPWAPVPIPKLTSAAGTPSGGRQCRTIIPSMGTSLPWGSCSKFFRRSAGLDQEFITHGWHSWPKAPGGCRMSDPGTARMALGSPELQDCLDPIISSFVPISPLSKPSSVGHSPCQNPAVDPISRDSPKLEILVQEQRGIPRVLRENRVDWN